MKLEESRRNNLDSKAHSYIGLLSIAITLLVAVGGILINDFTQTDSTIPDSTRGILILYLLTELFFVIGVIHAFSAYHTGSTNVPHVFRYFQDLNHKFIFSWDLNSRSEEERFKKWIAKNHNAEWILQSDVIKTNNNISASDNSGNSLDITIDSSRNEAKLSINNASVKRLIVKENNCQTNVYCLQKEVYMGMDTDWLAKKADIKKSQLYKHLIPHIQEILYINYNLNNKKSNSILKAYHYSMIAIFILLIISFLLFIEFII
jgi:hypothetical protein